MEYEHYKRLIDILKNGKPHTVLDYRDDFSSAIETLLAERNAAINDIQKMCKYCVRSGTSIYEEPCHSCLFNDEKSEMGKSWQWRGPQKEGG